MPTFRILPGLVLRQASSKRNSHEYATSEHTYLASGPGRITADKTATTYALLYLQACVCGSLKDIATSSHPKCKLLPILAGSFEDICLNRSSAEAEWTNRIEPRSSPELRR